MFSSAWFRIGLLLAAVGLFATATTPAMGREPRAFGQRLVAQYQLPPDTIARYAAMAAGTVLDASRREQSMFADRLPWVGPGQRAGVGQNPYTLVFTVNGVAKTAGEVYAQWQAGWEVHESPVARREVLMVVPPIARDGLAAGQALTLTASSTHVSFRGERTVAPMLGLVQMRNLDINDIQVQVWSGAPPLAWPAMPVSPAVLLALGATCLLVGLGIRYWQHTVREPGARQACRRAQPYIRRASPDAVERIEATAARDLPVAPAPSHQERVIAALQHVLTVGLAVHTVLDEARMPRRRLGR
jgi:hypothetical protein